MQILPWIEREALVPNRGRTAVHQSCGMSNFVILIEDRLAG